MIDDSAPMRSTERTQSIEVKPPPTVTTVLANPDILLPEIHILEELQTGNNAVQIFSRHAQFLRESGSRRR